MLVVILPVLKQLIDAPSFCCKNANISNLISGPVLSGLDKATDRLKCLLPHLLVRTSDVHAGFRDKLNNLSHSFAGLVAILGDCLR